MTASALPSASPGVTLTYVTLATGIRVHYAARGDADGSPVIFLHGYSDTWYSFSPLLSRMSPRVRAYALDQRGHGLSDAPRDAYAMRDLARDVVAFMDALGIARATIVGHSMGSFVAQQVLALAPQRVDGIVLLSGARHISRFTDIALLGEAVAALSDPVPLSFTEDFQRSTMALPVDEAFVARVSEDSRRLDAETWRAVFRGMMEMPLSDRRPERPALLLWGERDAFAPRDAQDELLAFWPTASLVTFPGTGHAPHWERPAQVVDALETYLDRLGR